jgi:hypothetical protein
MKLKFFYLICALTSSISLFPIFDTSPWIVIKNATKLDFVCKIDITCDELENAEFTLYFDAYEDLDIKFYDSSQYADGDLSLKATLTFTLPTDQTKIFNSIFYKDDILFLPKIMSVEFIHESLQLKTFCDPTEKDRYFSIEHQSDHGIITQASPIALYIKCLSNLKQTLQAVLAAALNATNWLPY